jgi:hypothetical protein
LAIRREREEVRACFVAMHSIVVPKEKKLHESILGQTATLQIAFINNRARIWDVCLAPVLLLYFVLCLEYKKTIAFIRETI